MELTSSQMQTVCHQFDSFCKRLLKNEARDIYKRVRYEQKNEVLFSEMSQREIDALMTTDKYPSDMCNFIVHGTEGENGKAMLVGIENDLLAIALSNLPEQSRDVVLLAYCLDMTDVEIAEALNMPRSTVQYQRTSSLNKIKKYMEGK